MLPAAAERCGRIGIGAVTKEGEAAAVTLGEKAEATEEALLEGPGLLKTASTAAADAGAAAASVARAACAFTEE